MKQKSIISLGAVAIALVAVIGLAGASLAASNSQDSQATNNPANKKWQPNREEIQAKRQAIESALEANDYQAWVVAVGADSEQAKIITSDKFPQLLQAHQLQQEAKTKFEEARQIREQLGLKGSGFGKKPGRGKGTGPRHGMIGQPIQPEQSN